MNIAAFSSIMVQNADIRSIYQIFEFKGQKTNFSFCRATKTYCKSSIGIPSVAEEIQIRHLVSQIELLEKHFLKIRQRIKRVFPQKQLSITHHAGISHFPVTSSYIRTRR